MEDPHFFHFQLNENMNIDWILTQHQTHTTVALHQTTPCFLFGSEKANLALMLRHVLMLKYVLRLRHVQIRR